MTRLNVRWKLTLWYGLVLTAIVVGFGAAIFLLMSRHLLARTDFELDEELTELVLEIQLSRDEEDLQRQLDARFFRHASFDSQVSRSDGRIVFRSERLQGVALPFPAASEDNQAESFGTTRVESAGPRRVASRRVAWNGQTLLAQSSMPLVENENTLRGLLGVLVLVGPLALLGGLAGGYFLARRALAPVERMVTTAEQITAGRLSERIEMVNPDDELGHLARTLNAMMDRLQQAVEEMRRFTADAAHELRTPLAVLVAESEVALRAPRSAEEYRRVVEVTLGEARRLTRLADQLLLLCRYDAGLLSPAAEREEVQLDALVRDVADQMALAAKQKGVALEVEPLGDLVVLGDDIQLSRLLFNLLDNAVKFTPAGGSVRVAARQTNGRVSVAVTDTGAGIAAVDLPRVFERFYRADKSRNGSAGGAGLGLAISRAIVESHGGSITIESRPGAGTTVRATLPAAAPVNT